MKRVALRFFGIFALMFCMSLTISQNSLAAGKNPRLNLKRLDLTKGTTFTLRVYNLGDDAVASFKSTDPDNVKINSVAANKRSAVIFGRTVGTAAIKVTIKKGGKVVDTLKCKVKVAPVPVSIKFTDKKVELKEGQQAYLDTIIKPYSATENPVFETSDDDIAYVNVRGLVTALSPGKVTITATLLSTGKKAKCTIIVNEDPND